MAPALYKTSCPPKNDDQSCYARGAAARWVKSLHWPNWLPFKRDTFQTLSETVIKMAAALRGANVLRAAPLQVNFPAARSSNVSRSLL